MIHRYFRRVSAAILVLAAVGCGSREQCFVEGTVTYQGKPVTGDTVVVFCPEIGCGGSASLNAEGAFRVEGALKAGTYLVMVQPPPAPPPHSLEGKKGNASRPVSRVPEKYRSDRTTDLHIEVSSGTKRVELVLQ